MSIRVDAYLAGGMASGILARSGHLRELLDAQPELTLERAAWQAIGESAPHPAGEVTVAIDDVLVAVADDEPTSPVHASWHPIHLEIGPYVLDGELPTLPGYDPGRALTRPTGEFVLLRDVRMALLTDPAAGVHLGLHALVNRYGVERVSSDIMLGFYFPGAALDGVDAATGPGGSGGSPGD
ncbi:MAG TPA: hypothetical protein VD763_11020 [Candidatus Saccharimonadales bacterium]|nr:hypothetical protein [Candidatus Saccharimonadales bacterium]